MLNIFKVFFDKYKKNITQLFYFFMFMALLYSIYSDIGYTALMPGDFRNRIVGARMMKDGLSPYFFIWKDGLPIRYYYDMDYRSLIPGHIVSPVTASPFFHHVFGLIADMPQYQLNTLWFGIEYSALAGCCLLAFFSISNLQPNHKILLITSITIIFTYTMGWHVHLRFGQNYIFIPLLMWGCYYFLQRRYNALNIILFAIISASLILIKPIALCVFIPMFFYPKKYFKWGLGTVATLLAYTVFVLANPVQKSNWTDYFKAIKVHTFCQQLTLAEKEQIFKTDSIPKYKNTVTSIEGVSFDADQVDVSGFISETSNFFVLYFLATGKKISINGMELIGFGCCFVLILPLFSRKIKLELPMLILLGFCIYFLLNFCQPICCYMYYWVEFLFPLLLLSTYVKKIYIIPIFLLFIGVLLNVFIHFFLFVKMRHTVGEFCIITASLLFIYRPFIFSLFNEEKWKINNNVYWL